MKDSVVQVTFAGIIGAVVMDLIMYLVILLGVTTTAPWVIAAYVFLTPGHVYTVSGTIIGLIGTVALNVAAAALTLLLCKLTGFDYAVFKGIITINAFSFITMGLFMPLLNIAPQIRQQPVTNYLALLVLSIIGGIEAYILKKLNPNGLSHKQKS